MKCQRVNKVCPEPSEDTALPAPNSQLLDLTTVQGRLSISAALSVMAATLATGAHMHTCTRTHMHSRVQVHANMRTYMGRLACICQSTLLTRADSHPLTPCPAFVTGNGQISCLGSMNV